VERSELICIGGLGLKVLLVTGGGGRRTLVWSCSVISASDHTLTSASEPCDQDDDDGGGGGDDGGGGDAHLCTHATPRPSALFLTYINSANPPRLLPHAPSLAAQPRAQGNVPMSSIESPIYWSTVKLAGTTLILTKFMTKLEAPVLK
jgi:hypothetical protein